MTDDRHEDIATSYLFEGDFAPYRSLFEKYCPAPMQVSHGQRICKKGITKGWMYYLAKGTVKIYSNNFEGHERLVAYLKDDSLFGLDCFNPDKPSIVTIECVSDVWVMPFQKDILKRIMDEDKAFAYDLVEYYAKVLRQLCFDAENQSIGDASIRLANFLYLFIENQQDANVNISQQDLAAAINASRSSVARACAQLKNEGVIRTNGRGLTVISEEKLRARCRF